MDDVSFIQHARTLTLLILILQTSLTAAHCAKTLVASALTGNPILRQCVRLEFIAKMVLLAQDGGVRQALSASIYTAAAQLLRPGKPAPSHSPPLQRTRTSRSPCRRLTGGRRRFSEEELDAGGEGGLGVAGWCFKKS